MSQESLWGVAPPPALPRRLAAFRGKVRRWCLYCGRSFWPWWPPAEPAVCSLCGPPAAGGRWS